MYQVPVIFCIRWVHCLGVFLLCAPACVLGKIRARMGFIVFKGVSIGGAAFGRRSFTFFVCVSSRMVEKGGLGCGGQGGGQTIPR